MSTPAAPAEPAGSFWDRFNRTATGAWRGATQGATSAFNGRSNSQGAANWAWWGAAIGAIGLGLFGGGVGIGEMLLLAIVGALIGMVVGGALHGGIQGFMQGAPATPGERPQREGNVRQRQQEQGVPRRVAAVEREPVYRDGEFLPAPQTPPAAPAASTLVPGQRPPEPVTR